MIIRVCMITYIFDYDYILLNFLAGETVKRALLAFY